MAVEFTVGLRFCYKFIPFDTSYPLKHLFSEAFAILLYFWGFKLYVKMKLIMKLNIPVKLNIVTL